MAGLVPHRFLVRFALACPYVKSIPDPDGDHLFDLPATAELRNYAELDGGKRYADVRLAWNEFGLGVQMTVLGKSEEPTTAANKPRLSDGLTLWIDTRDSRGSHRASRYCHQFHFLPTGGGTDNDEPHATQTKLNRAIIDAPLCNLADLLIRRHRVKSGYRLEAFLPAVALTGFDPDQHPRLGVYYQVRDAELGDQFLGVNADFPFSDDPSLWDVLELTK
jgi:hypothetical protein